MVDPRAPVVVGVGQINQHVAAEEARPPIDLLADAARAAETDSGVALLSRVDIVAVVAIGSWPYADPGAHRRAHARASHRARRRCRPSAATARNSSSTSSRRASSSGECDVVLDRRRRVHAHALARAARAARRAHVGRRRRRAVRVGDRRRPARLQPVRDGAPRGRADDGVPAVRDRAARRRAAGRSRSTRQVRERAVVALRGRGRGEPGTRGRTTAYTRRRDPHRLGRQPHGVLPVPEAHVRQHRRRPGRRAAALLVRGRARAAGVPDDRMVFLHAAAEAHDHYFVTERCVARRLAGDRGRDGRRARGRGQSASTTSPTSISTRASRRRCRSPATSSALRPDDPRPLTVTGGLGFAGGPVNNYPTHAIARMVEVLRADPDAYGLTTALGWYVTKHTAAVWSARPPARPFVTHAPAGPGRRAPRPRAGRPGRHERHRRSDIGRVRARRHAQRRHRHRAARRRPPRARQHAATPMRYAR